VGAGGAAGPAMLDSQARERQEFMRRINKATGDRQPTLPLGEHDPLDDRQQAPDEPCTCGNAILHARSCPKSPL
jgi:hypothetical protein